MRYIIDASASPCHHHAHPRPESGQFCPEHHKRPSRRGIPVAFDIVVAFFPDAMTVMMADPAFEGLVAGAVKLTEVVPEEGAAVRGVEITGEIHLVPPERRGEDAE